MTNVSKKCEMVRQDEQQGRILGEREREKERDVGRSLTMAIAELLSEGAERIKPTRHTSSAMKLYHYIFCV